MKSQPQSRGGCEDGSGGCLSSGGQPPPRRASAPQAVVRKLSLPENNDGGADNAKVKALFKSKPKTPVDLMMELGKLMRELKQVLYGDSESEPVAEACAQLTQEFFRENTLRLLIICLPKLNLETRKDATQVVANLQRQQVQSRLIACDYLEKNIDLMDTLIAGYENTDMALHYGAMLRECIRHQSVARYVLESEHMKNFFDYIQLPNFDIASDAAATFKLTEPRTWAHRLRCRALSLFHLGWVALQCMSCHSTVANRIHFLLQELLTRHKSTVAEFLSKNYDWLLGDILLDRSNSAVMTRYVCSRDNLRILMNLLRESSKSIQIEAFHVFKLFAANQNKPPDIVGILCTNKNKLLRLFADLKTDKEDEQFEADKAQVVKEIAALEPK
ncbi:hypothetical protein DH2020_017193 [Rehmannia glutinosa]|uniref:MO25-like protein n=1 Tax=Rehmannia glutinosa TaxID=99300 RepID=A0ABR0WQ49_REHGL